MTIRFPAAALGAAALCISVLAPLAAQVELGAARSFAVFGAASVTNTGATTVGGDLGVGMTSSSTGFPPGIVTGIIHGGDAAYLAAETDAFAAYNAIVVQTPDLDLSGVDLGGLTLAPGIYSFSDGALLTGSLVLDAAGDPDAVFVIKVGTSLTASVSSAVVLVNGGSACRVLWQIGTSASLGAGSTFTGNLFAAASVTLGSGATVTGRVFALIGTVAMDTNVVQIPSECLCAGPASSAANLGPGEASVADAVLSATAPIYGGMLTISVASPDPLAALILVGRAGDPISFAVEATGNTAYFDYRDPSAFFIVTEAVLDASGNWSVTRAIPFIPSLIGLRLALQAFVYSPLLPSGLCWRFSNGILLEIGCA